MMQKLLMHNLQYYLAAQPWTGSNILIESFDMLKSGIDSDVYRFTLSYDDDGGARVSQQLVLKIYSDTSAGKDRALKERHALYRLFAGMYAVPRVLLAEIDTEHLGRPFIVMEYVGAETMQDHITRAGDDSQELDALAQLFADLMVSLHTQDYKLLVPRMDVPSPLALVNREIHTMRGLLKEYGLPQLAPVLDWLYANRGSAPSARASITHRDFHPSNVLIESGIPRVVDWGWQISDARFDLAWTLAQLQREGQGDFAARVLREYERSHGAPLENLAYFSVMAEVRWLISTLARARYGLEASEKRAEYIKDMTEPVKAALDLIQRETGITLSGAETLFE